MTPQENLKNLGLKLPQASTPGGSYSSVNIRGHIAYVAIQFPIWNNEYKFQGRLGNEISTEQGYKAMEVCALNVLAQINKKSRVHQYYWSKSYRRLFPSWKQLGRFTHCC